MAVANPHALGGAPNGSQSIADSHNGLHALALANVTHSAMPYSQSETFSQGIVQ